MSNIPCKNCITFAICNAQITDVSPYSDIVDKLVPKCSLIEEYIQYYNRSSTKSVIKVARLFKPHGIL